MGQETVAEGVEDATALELLRRLGVDYAQGYLICRPQPVKVDQLREPEPEVPRPNEGSRWDSLSSNVAWRV